MSNQIDSGYYKYNQLKFITKIRAIVFGVGNIYKKGAGFVKLIC